MKTDNTNNDNEIDKLENSVEEQIKMAILIFGHVESHIRAADSKAWLIVAANGVLVNLLSKESIDSKDIHILLAIYFLSIILSIFLALKVVSPIMKKSATKNLFFFGSIVNLNESYFVNQFKAQTQKDILTSILSEIYIKAKIANIKFLRLRWSIIFFFIALSTFLIAQLIQSASVHLVSFNWLKIC